MKPFYIFLILHIFLITATFGQSVNKAKLDTLFNNIEQQGMDLGSVAISQHGKVIYQRTFGEPQSALSTYRIGSITKMFTAVLVYQLIDAHRLSLDDTLARFFPQIPNAGKITIRMMLGHRSGLPNFTSPDATHYDDWKFQPKTHDELLAMITKQSPDFVPDTKPDYNNSNYLLLGYIIEKLYRKPYKEVVTERIVKKTGLEHTYYCDHAGFTGQEAASYKIVNGKWTAQQAVYVDDFGGAGAMISTPADMCKFITAIFGGKFISKKSLDEMTHIIQGYGKGMFPYGDDKHHGYGHDGKTEGFASSLSYYPESGLTIAYCTNGVIFPKDDIVDLIFNICFNLPCKVPSFKTIALNHDALANYTGTFTGDHGLQVTVTNNNSQLTLEIKGAKFLLDAVSDHEFVNRQFGFFFEFRENGSKLLIKDDGSVYWLNKK